MTQNHAGAPHVDCICISAGQTILCTTEGSQCALSDMRSTRYTMTHCTSPKCARGLDILPRGLCLALSAHCIVPSEPELQHITCDRWQLSHQGACQEICEACICPEGHTRGDPATLSHQRCYTWCKSHAAKMIITVCDAAKQ